MLVLLSDIHGNYTALKSVLDDINNKYSYGKIIHLGDCVDYGMRPNEVIDELIKINDRVLVNIKGNHEMALNGYQFERFSSQRGKDANLYTNQILNTQSHKYIQEIMSDNYVSIEYNKKKILIIHGDLSDIYWGKMTNEEMLKSIYQEYDYVFSGHTHHSCFHTVSNKSQKHTTIFINPGSVGQPRNYNNKAQYCVVNTKTNQIFFESVLYNIDKEIKLYNNEIDEYYKNRLLIGE